MRRSLVVGMLATAALAGEAVPARAALFTELVCTSTSLNICINFTLASAGGNDYTLTAAFTQGGGIMTNVGLYAGSDLNATINSISAPAGQDWTDGDETGLSGGGISVFEVAAGADAPPTGPNGNGLVAGETLVISFTSSTNLVSYSGLLGARAHVQAIPDQDPNDSEVECSLKLDTEANGAVGGEANCIPNGGGGGTGSTVPEPMTMLLLGSGLLGIGGAKLRRRRERQLEL